MCALKFAAAMLLLLTGSISTACAQSDAPSAGPPFGQDPDSKRPPRDRVRQLEAEIHELEAALEGKETTPEQRKKWARQLELAHAELRDIRDGRKPKDGQIPHQERLMARLRELEAQMKGAGPEDQRELKAQMEKIREELKRGDLQYDGQKMGPPMDPETLRLHGEIKELEMQTHGLGMKLRSLPAESKEDRAEVQGKLKESVTKLFDLREQARAKEIDNLKKRLEELTRMIEKRKANRDQIIERRIRQLSGELDELDW